MSSEPTSYGFFDLVTLVQQNWRRLLTAGVAVAIAMGLPALLKSRVYTSHSSFTAETTSAGTRMNVFAAQLGIPLGTSSGGESPDFYAALLRSQDILSEVAQSTFQQSPTSKATPLVDILDVKGPSYPVRLDAAVTRLRGMVVAQSITKTGVITLDVTASSPQLAHDMADSILSDLNRFNLERRQTRATAERRFVEARLAQVRFDLRASEEALASFLLTNKQITSPTLSLARDRLQQDVDLHRSLFTSLSQSYEQARIDEVRNIPVISPVEQASLPVRPDSRRVVVKTAAGFVAGVILAILWTIGLARVRLWRRGESGEAAIPPESPAELGTVRAPRRSIR